jgi:hypothetical protein
MNRALNLSPDVLGLIRDALPDILGISISADGASGRWSVIAVTGDVGVVLHRGISRARATDWADEARYAVLALRAGANNPATGAVCPPGPRPAPPLARGATFDRGAAAGAGRRQGAAGGQRDATVPNLAGVPVMTIAANRMIPPGAWTRIGATYPAGAVKMVHWRTRFHARPTCHFSADRATTLCGRPIPLDDGAATVAWGTRAGTSGTCAVCEAKRESAAALASAVGTAL